MNLNKYLNVIPYPYQIEGAQFALNHHYCIIADDMGLGKTLQALMVFAVTRLKTICVVPAYLRQNWLKETKKFLKEETKVVVCNTTNDINLVKDFDILIISYGQLLKAQHLFKGVGLVIGDEIHYVKSPKSKRTINFHEIIEFNKPERFIGLSGTPIKNRVPEFYTVVGLCSYNERKTSGPCILSRFSYWQFCEQFCFKETVRTTGGGKATKFFGHRNVPLLKKYLKGKYLRRLSDDILDLPELIEKDVLVDYNKKDEMLLQAWESFNSGKSQEHYSTVKAKSAELKAKFTVEYVKELMDADQGPILVFTDHLRSCFLIADSLGKNYRVGLVNGSVPAHKRQGIVDEIQNGELDILVATISSLNTGFNITACNNVVFNDESWVPAENAQAKKRVHRIGQDKRCVIHNIRGSKIDMDIGAALLEKEITLRKVT